MSDARPGPAADPGFAPPGARRGRGRLDVRLFLIVLSINLVTFGVAAALLVPRLSAERETQALELASGLVRTLQASLRPERGANVAAILDWSGWSEMRDAILVDNQLTSGADGTLGPVATGIHLNPLGAANRRPDLDVRAVLQALGTSLATGEAREVAGGRTVPIRVRDRDWGACWFQLPEEDFLPQVARTLLPGFLLSTLLISLGTFATLRRLVLSPLDRLTDTARAMGRGDLSARVEAGRSVGEIEELVGGFNRMADQVEGFNRELEARVEVATGEARAAQQAAMIQQRMAAMGELAAGIAHEINNPLGGLQNAVRALARGGIDEARRERYLALLDEGLERIGGIVGQVLRMAPRETEPQPFDLRGVVRDAAALVAHRARNEGVALEARVGEEPWGEPERLLEQGSEQIVLGVREELVQAVLNLLVNGLDALEERGGDDPAPRIRVALERAAQELSVVVTDNGPGARPEALDRARDLFFTTKDPGRGTGLGLSIVHNICDSHGGRLDLASSPGEGFTATLRLPLARDGEVRP